MSITGIEANKTINVLNLNNSTKSQKAEFDRTQEISDTFSESGETQKFKEIVGKYDITNMSRNEANKMFHELYDNGLINLKDMLLVTFDPTRVPSWQDGKSSVCGWKVSSDPDKKMNYLEGFKTQAEWYKKYGDSEFQQRYDDALALAEKIKYFQS